MTPTNTSLVKYDNPKLVSRSTDPKAQRKQKSPQQSPAPGVPGKIVKHEHFMTVVDSLYFIHFQVVLVMENYPHLKSKAKQRIS